MKLKGVYPTFWTAGRRLSEIRKKSKTEVPLIYVENVGGPWRLIKGSVRWKRRAREDMWCTLALIDSLKSPIRMMLMLSLVSC